MSYVAVSSNGRTDRPTYSGFAANRGPTTSCLIPLINGICDWLVRAWPVLVYCITALHHLVITTQLASNPNASSTVLAFELPSKG